MDNIKITVNFTLPGSVMYEEQDCQSDPNKSDTRLIDVFDKKLNKSITLKYKTRRSKPVTQCINMTEEAYRGMLDIPVAGMTSSHWKRMSPAAKVIEYLKLIQHDLKATSFDFTIYDD